jgi:hypothetical protein
MEGSKTYGKEMIVNEFIFKFCFSGSKHIALLCTLSLNHIRLSCIVPPAHLPFAAIIHASHWSFCRRLSYHFLRDTIMRNTTLLLFLSSSTSNQLHPSASNSPTNFIRHSHVPPSP